MTHYYEVKGIACDGCIDNIKKALAAVPHITGVEVQRSSPQLRLSMDRDIDTALLKEAVKKYGNYELFELQ
jgi:copper chaperone